MRWLILGAALLASAPVEAKKKKVDTSGTVTKERDAKPPRGDDMRINEGAQGRRNATNDAAGASQGSWNERRP